MLRGVVRAVAPGGEGGCGSVTGTGRNGMKGLRWSYVVVGLLLMAMGWLLLGLSLDVMLDGDPAGDPGFGFAAGGFAACVGFAMLNDALGSWR